MTPRKSNLDPLVRRFIEHAGNLTQSFGLGRVIGQIYAYLYFSSEPRNLAEMQETLGVSKGSASTAVRQLEQWGAAHKVWVRGDRKDYYEGNPWLGGVVRSALADLAARKMAAYERLIAELEGEMAATGATAGEGDGGFLRERVGRLRTFRKRAGSFWNNPLLQGLLKTKREHG